ncbi:MAG: NAD(+)/NADH kinase [Thermoanaerobaculia bacterium]
MTRRADIRRVAVVAKRVSQEALRTAAEVADWLIRRGLEVVLDEAVPRARELSSGETFELTGSYDLVIVLGGDGTLLSIARSLKGEVPILGVNLGNLGFLTEIGRAELYPTLVDVLAGSLEVEERALLDVALERASGEGASYRVVNDAVVTKSALARIIELTLRVDGRLVAAYRSDGLIISTPTGSTAYNLSAGGPIVNPLLPVMMVTPICPHTLSLRPIVVPDTSAIEVTLETRSEEVYLTLDGQEGTTLGFRDTVRVRRSESNVQLIKSSRRTFYDNLRDKLHWGE